MAEDILEQIGHNWLVQTRGRFVKENLKYRPRTDHPDYDPQADRIHSDIDLLSVDIADPTRLKVFNCKSWMDGFDCKFFSRSLSDESGHQKHFGGKEVWKHFRELLVPRWTEAFVDRIRSEVPAAESVDYIILCVFAKNFCDLNEWRSNIHIQNSFSNQPLQIQSFSIMTIQDLIKELPVKTSDYAESSHFARTLQLLKAGGVI